MTNEYTVKPYLCSNCLKEFAAVTDHWDTIYSGCPSCKKRVKGNIPCKCLEQHPDFRMLPSPWKIVRMGAVWEIVPRATCQHGDTRD